MRRLLLLSILASACASAPAKPQASASSADSVEKYFPLAIGNSWTYQTTFGKRIEENTVTIVDKEGSFFRDDRKNLLAFDTDGLRDSQRYLIRKPVRRGATWKSIVDLGKTNHFEILDTSATVTVPAGTFHHVLVVRGVDDSESGHEMELESAYAPGVGLVRVATVMVIGKRERIPQVTIELLRYKVK